jgi:serine protease AprX
MKLSKALFTLCGLFYGSNAFASDQQILLYNSNTDVSNLSKSIKIVRAFPKIKALVVEGDPLTIAGFRSEGYNLHPVGVKNLSGKFDGMAKPTRDLSYTYGLENIGIIKVRKELPTVLGKGVSVGIIDSGIDPIHPAFKDKKIVFKDFTKKAKSNPYDDNGHGTHVAGTIAGVGGTPYFGIAPQADLVVAKVFSEDGSADDVTILAAMEWMSEQNVKVVNASWGGPKEDDKVETPYSRMLRLWISKGIFPSFAAGNDGPDKSSVNLPGAQLEAFAVGSVDSADAVSMFSSRGPVIWAGKSYVKPEICAPGSRVYSAIPGGKYAYFSGTSMATPHVTGVVALLAQVKALSVDKVSQVLRDNADKIKVNENDCGSGRLNAFSMLKAIKE